MTASTAPAAPDAAGSAFVRRPLANDAASLTILNLLSRVTGLVRIVAVAGALGTTALGDTYQSANVVSNVLFELLAGGLLSAVLVPSFVELLERGDRAGSSRLAGGVLSRALAVLAAVVVVAMVASPLITELLTAGVPDGAARESRQQLGTFLLVFFLPQVLLYAVGAVASGLLQADRRFAAAALAPVANNVVVVATMLLFSIHHDGGGLDLPLAERLILALGTTGGVLAMSTVVVVALHRSGLSLTPRWHAGGDEVRRLLHRGAWAAGHLGVNQLLVLTTVVVAAGVTGGVVAYQVAFTFFLLPHALLAHPITTALYPRFAADGRAGRIDDLAAHLEVGLRSTSLLLVPAAVLLAALAPALVELIRLGDLDAAGASLVSAATAAYAFGLIGYSSFFLLTRASYALDDTRSPALFNAASSAIAAAAMCVAALTVDGEARLIAVGIAHAGCVTFASALLLVRVQRRMSRRLPVLAGLGRDIVAGAVAGAIAWAVSNAIGTDDRSSAALALAAGSITGIATYVVIQTSTGMTELRALATEIRQPR